jgi:hypothetical protein
LPKTSPPTLRRYSDVGSHVNTPIAKMTATGPFHNARTMKTGTATRQAMMVQRTYQMVLLGDRAA